MPCDAVRDNRTPEQRASDVLRAVMKLGREIEGGRIRVKISPAGSVAFDGWGGEDRDGVTDLCAYRALLSSPSSWALRQAIARAEAQTGRKLNEQAIARGEHSHDGGKTWDKK